MKTIAVTLGTALLALLGTTISAEARYSHRGHPSSHVYVSGHRSCGTPIYTERYFVGYDCRGNPIWGYRQIVHTPRRVVAPCPPQRVVYPRGGPIVHHPYHGRSGVVIRGNICR
jgi:hypothetical protein